MKNIENYKVGPLLYMPADTDIVKIKNLFKKNVTNFSIALCLEDTIRDDFVQSAEKALCSTLFSLNKEKEALPKIFVRVRTPEQIFSLLQNCEAKGIWTNMGEITSGFILPKFSTENAKKYIKTIKEINQGRENPFSIMPILESHSLIDPETRIRELKQIKEEIREIEEYILNIRVGGNDLCHAFGFRRQMNEVIYDILPIASILSDIVTVFGQDYVISAPVWEYYDGEHWDTSLQKEIRKDFLCGFIGKTVIHPKQIPFVAEGFKVSKKDFEDAEKILNWKEDRLVFSSAAKERMNEYKVHYNWAEKIMMLAKTYGIKE